MLWLFVVDASVTGLVFTGWGSWPGFSLWVFLPIDGCNHCAHERHLPRGCSLSGLYPSTNPAWLDLPGTRVPAGTALRVIETPKPHHHYKVTAQHSKVNLHKTSNVFSVDFQELLQISLETYRRNSSEFIFT